MKLEIITKVFYALSACNYCAYLATKQSAFMFSGGILLIAASIMLIVSRKKKK